MKKITAFVLAVLIAISLLSSCGTESTAVPADQGKLRIVVTIFPEYDWVKEILGSNPAGAELTLIMENGVDIHSYQPTADDILTISSCDLFIWVGGESEHWVQDALREPVNKGMTVISLIDMVGDSVKEEETVEGMQDSEEEGGEPEYDEHVWLSLRNAELLCGKIADALSELDPENGTLYRENADTYIGKLRELDGRYTEAVAQARIHTLLFGDRFPFRYLADDLGLDYYAAFSGCSAETEASFETVTFLAGKVDELGLGTVLTIEGTDHRIAETIVENTSSKDQQILSMDSMQSCTLKDIEAGTTYLSIMEKNLEILKEALK